MDLSQKPGVKHWNHVHVAVSATHVEHNSLPDGEIKDRVDYMEFRHGMPQVGSIHSRTFSLIGLILLVQFFTENI